MGFVHDMQINYIGEKIFDYDEIACTWYSFFEKASNKSGLVSAGKGNAGGGSDFSNMFSTGTSIFKTVFGNLTLILSYFSSFIFSLTTFITMFMMTVQLSNQSSAVK